jgi:hypothetical protein
MVDCHGLYFVGSLGLFVFGSYKTIPLEVWTGPEGSRRLNLPDLKIIGT